MEELIKFWKYIKKLYDAEEIADVAEDFDFDTKRFTKAKLSKLTEEEIDVLFGELIDFVMDGMGMDNYGDIHDMLTDIGLGEERIAEILS